MARSTRTNYAKAKIWTERSICDIEGTIAGVSLMAFQCIATAAEREEVLKHMRTWHEKLQTQESK